MGRIKSAWEIALERTENIEVDAEKIRHSANREGIRKIAGAYLLSDEDTEESTREKLLQYGSDDKREALGQTIINALSLPQEEKSDDKKAQRLSFLQLLLCVIKCFLILISQPLQILVCNLSVFFIILKRKVRGLSILCS